MKYPKKAVMTRMMERKCEGRLERDKAKYYLKLMKRRVKFWLLLLNVLLQFSNEIKAREDYSSY